MSIDVLQSTNIPAGTWSIDASHSEVGFTARHLMSKVRGSFEKFEGQIVTGDAPLATASIDLNSIDTRDANRDAHLRSGDFFDVENSGPMTFVSTSFDGTAAKGELTIKGVTNTVALDVEFLGIDKDAYGNTRIGFEATTTINRKDFGVDFDIPLDGGKLLVGHKVDIQLSVQAVLDQA
jgi:polyisoprenoid-binding protein YceI